VPRTDWSRCGWWRSSGPDVLVVDLRITPVRRLLSRPPAGTGRTIHAPRSSASTPMRMRVGARALQAGAPWLPDQGRGAEAKSHSALHRAGRPDSPLDWPKVQRRLVEAATRSRHGPGQGQLARLVEGFDRAGDRKSCD